MGGFGCKVVEASAGGMRKVEKKGTGKLAFIFPGQGSQSVGMGKALYDACPSAREVFDEAESALGMDLKRLCFDGPEVELNLTENTQPALLAASVAALRVLEKEVPLFPDFVAGHSLGEYTALVCAGVLKFQDALRLVRLRGRFMQESVPGGVGRQRGPQPATQPATQSVMMSAVIGLAPETLDEICKKISAGKEQVVCANINSPEQVVISGTASAVSMAGEEAKKRGAKRVIPLPVSVPSHSPLMEGAAQKLYTELLKVPFGDLKVALVTNVEAEPCNDPAKIKGLLMRQLTSPVRWVDVIRRVRSEGVSITLEIGPGNVLSGLVRRIDKGIEALNFSAPEDIHRIKDFFGFRLKVRP